MALTYYFQKSATDTWNVFVTANGTTVGGTALGADADHDDDLPGQRRRADRAGRADHAQHPGIDQRRTAPRRCRSPASSST